MTPSTVLFVDDEPGVLNAMKRLFRGEETVVLTASGGAEGLAMLKDHPVQLVISDQRMPGMSGTEFLKQVRELYPEAVRCILSGYAEMDSVIAAINDGHVYRFIAKPWEESELKQAINECLQVAGSLSEQRRARVSLESRAIKLEEESARFSELISIQESLLKSSRDVLDQLPCVVAALDAKGRLIYTNQRFAQDFGHLPGTALGQVAGEPWLGATEECLSGATNLCIDGASYSACVKQIDIGGQRHSLITLSSHCA